MAPKKKLEAVPEWVEQWACPGCAQKLNTPHRATCPLVKPPPFNDEKSGMPFVMKSECDLYEGYIIRRVGPAEAERIREAEKERLAKIERKD